MIGDTPHHVIFLNVHSQFTPSTDIHTTSGGGNNCNIMAEKEEAAQILRRSLMMATLERVQHFYIKHDLFHGLSDVAHVMKMTPMDIILI